MGLTSAIGGVGRRSRRVSNKPVTVWPVGKVSSKVLGTSLAYARTTDHRVCGRQVRRTPETPPFCRVTPGAPVRATRSGSSSNEASLSTSTATVQLREQI